MHAKPGLMQTRLAAKPCVHVNGTRFLILVLAFAD